MKLKDLKVNISAVSCDDIGDSVTTGGSISYG